MLLRKQPYDKTVTGGLVETDDSVAFYSAIVSRETEQSRGKRSVSMKLK